MGQDVLREESAGAPVSLPENQPTAETLRETAELFKLLGDGTRLQIVAALLRQEQCVWELCSLLGISQSAASHQLRLLRAGKLVKYRREGKQIFYSLEDQHVLNIVVQGLEHIAHSKGEPLLPDRP